MRRNTVMWLTAVAPLAGAAAVSFIPASWPAYLVAVFALPFWGIWARVDHLAGRFVKPVGLFLLAACAAWSPPSMWWAGTHVAWLVKVVSLVVFAAWWWAVTAWTFHEPDEPVEEVEEEPVEEPKRFVVVDYTPRPEDLADPPTLEERTRTLTGWRPAVGLTVDETPEDDPEGRDSFVAELREKWPAQRRRDDGRVSIADLANLLEITPKEVQSRCRMEGIPVERVPVRSLAPGGSSGPKNAVAWSAIRPGGRDTACDTAERAPDLRV